MSHINVNDVLSAFEAAKAAYADMPERLREIDDLKSQLDHERRRSEQLTKDYNDLQVARTDLENKLHATEVERDQYFFRAEEAQEKLDHAAKALGLDTPKADLSPFPTEEGKSVPTTGTTTPSSDDTQSIGQSEALPTQFGGATGNVGGATESATTTTDPLASGQGQSESHPTVSTDGANTQDGAKAMETVIASGAYAGQPSSAKPYWMGWNEWKEKGGIVPSWVSAA